MLSIIVAMAALLPSVNHHPDGALEYSFMGTAHGRKRGALPVTLWAKCLGTTPIGVRIEVSARDTQLGLTQFGGHPNAPQETLHSRVTWIAPERKLSIVVPVSLWRPRNSSTYPDSNSYQAETSQGELSALLRAIEGGGMLEWTEPAVDSADNLLGAAFAVSCAAANNLQWLIGQCSKQPNRLH